MFFELNKDALVIAITGTNGKSTTCKIIEKILKSAGYNVKTGGNIGKPVLSLIRSKKKKYFYFGNFILPARILKAFSFKTRRNIEYFSRSLRKTQKHGKIHKN